MIDVSALNGILCSKLLNLCSAVLNLSSALLNISSTLPNIDFYWGQKHFSYGLPRTFLLLRLFPAGKNGLHSYEPQTKRV